jgi:DNA-binding LacI/PurR family transcriptional regulator
MIGIRRLAKQLNMSISTVSRALNGAADSSEETQKRVRAAAAELGYVPNQSGRSLRRGMTGAIGFMMQTGPEMIGQGDTFFISVFEGVQTVLARHHLDLVVLPCPTNEDADEYLRRTVSRGFVDGVIISNTRRVDPRIEFLASRHMPFVAFGRSTTDAGQPWIDLDFEAMAQQSIDRLVGKGHRRIAVTLPHGEDLNFSHIFIEHSRLALAAHGIELDPKLILRSLPTERGGNDIAHRLVSLRDRPTAIVVLSEPLLAGLYRGLTERNYLPGRDIAVIGREGPQSTFLTPTLTRFAQSLDDLGMGLAEALLASMPRYADQYPVGLVQKVWPQKLLIGESDAFTVRDSRKASRGRILKS